MLNQSNHAMHCRLHDGPKMLEVTESQFFPDGVTMHDTYIGM